MAKLNFGFPLLREGPIPSGRQSEILALLGREGAIGGVASFFGLVRADDTEEGTVRAIEFSAYDDMVRPALEQIIRDAEAEVSGSRVYVEHALGRVGVGEAPVLIVAGAEHREEAFLLCRSVLEKLKAEVPIYGKELVDGDRYRWKENR